MRAVSTDTLLRHSVHAVLFGGLLLFLLLPGILTLPDEDSVTCNLPLGMEKLLPDSAFEATKGENAAHARLNNANGAWKFPMGEDDTSLTVTLPEPRLVTGFKCQGPPAAILDKSYWQTVKLDVSVSADAKYWITVNGTTDDDKMFPCNDESDKIDVPSGHVWNASVVVRYIKFTVLAAMVKPGKDEAYLRLEIYGCGKDDVMPVTNLSVVATEDGKLDVTWNHPLLWNDVEDSMRLRVTRYILSFAFDANLEVEPNTTEVSYKRRRVSFFNSFLGANYMFQLTCVVGEISFNCRSLIVSTFPSCPSYWYQVQTTCLHKGSKNGGWSAVKDRCEKLFKDPENAMQSAAPPVSTKMWLGTKECLTYHTEYLENHECCGTYDQGSQAVSSESCPSPDTSQPFVCVIHKEVIFASITHVEIASVSPTSVKLSWSYEDQGWRPFVLDIKLTTADGAAVADQKTVYKTFATFDNLKADTHYAAHFSSPVDPSKMKYTKKFYIAAEGAMAEVILNTYIVWQGKLRIEWDSLQATDPKGGKLAATGYTLEWQTVGGRKQSVTTTLPVYIIDFPAMKEDYSFKLTCEVAKKKFVCGEKTLHTGIQDILINGEGAALTIQSYHNVKRDWKSANDICTKHGGFLTSILSEEENTRIKKFATEMPYWIGGVSCDDKKKGFGWVDKSPVSYIKIEQLKYSSNPEQCCLQVAPRQGTIYWIEEFCSQRQYFVCKYNVPEAVDAVKAPKAEQIGTDKILLSWTAPTTRWQPEVYVVSRCASRSDQSCAEVARTKTSPAVLISTSEPATPHHFRIESMLSPLKATKSEYVDIVTAEVSYTLNSEGVMKLQWTTKVKEGKEKTPCEVKFHAKSGPSTAVQSAQGTAKEIEVTGIRVATAYTFTVSEKGGANKYDFEATLYPNCAPAEEQFEMTCYQLNMQSHAWKDAKKECAKSGQRLAEATSDSSTRQQLLALKAANVKQKLWIAYEPPKGGGGGAENSVGADCYMVIPERQDIERGDCNEKLQFLCEKQAEIKMLSVPPASVSVDQNETSALIKWAEPKSWKAFYYLVTVEKSAAGAKAKRSTSTTQKVESTSYEVNDLEPGTPYTVTIAAVTQGSDSKDIEAKPETKTFETNKIPEPIPTPEFEPALDSESEKKITNYYNSSVPDSLRVFHIIGCSTLVGLVGLAFLIFLFSGMWSFRDGLAQINLQISLLIVHILFILMLEFPDQVEFHSAAISIHFFYTACFSFLMIECILYAKALTTLIPPGVLSTKIQVLIVGWVPVLLVIGLSAGLLFDQYPKQYHCWLKLDTDVLYATVIPIGIFGTVSLGLLLACLCCRPTHNYEVDEESYIRERVMENMRWIILLILMLLSISWACGMVGMDQSEEVLLLVFIIFNIILGVTIFILRCFGDAEVRQRLKACCSSGKVAPETNGLEAFIPQKQIENPDKFKLTPPQSGSMKGTRDTSITRRGAGARLCTTTTSLPAVD